MYVDDSNGRLGTVNVATGAVNLSGSMGTVMTDIAFDPKGHLLAYPSPVCILLTLRLRRFPLLVIIQSQVGMPLFSPRMVRFMVRVLPHHPFLRLIYTVETATGLATNPVNFGGSGLGISYGQSFFSEAVPTIPEPETYAMLLAGLGLVGFMAGRKRRIG